MQTSDHQIRKPDFIICGAMKSGTTSLHGLLEQQDIFYLPKGELHYFCSDDLSEHAPFRGRNSGRWHFQSFSDDNLESWYLSQFKDAPVNSLIGEDSTVYMASSIAPSRIHSALPDVKLIFMLRNPVDRLWSHYWHLVRSGRAMFKFDKMLEIQPETLLNRGNYKDQIQLFSKYFPRTQTKFVLLEDLKENPQQLVSDVANWLAPSPLEKVKLEETHFHKGRYPKSLSLQILRNRLLQGIDRRLYQAHYPHVIDSDDLPGGIFPNLVEKLFIRINPHNGIAPQMDPGTRSMLVEYYRKKNHGLGQLIDRPEVDNWS